MAMEKILVVDDDPAIRRLLEMVLRRGGYEVVVAKDGLEGWEMAQKQRPALIICDWLMPKLTGLGLCQLVKETPAIATTFFILLTSLTSSQDRVKGLDAGADDFLFKPLEVNELQARVRAELRLYHLNQDLHQQKCLLEKELKEAADYMASLLPKPIDHPCLTVKTLYRPSQNLGGDAYDYFWLDDTHFALYLLDVSGHGMGATLLALSVINFLRSQKSPKQYYYQPDHILAELNHSFPMGNNNKYFTIWYGVYNVVTKQLSYASAGHPPGILCPSL
jgi:sigma-B regulation protein RsbU (phosphoserine phosphatase)